jgi:hypothetical protein
MSVDVVFVRSWLEQNSEARCKLLFEDDGKRRSTLNVKTARPGPCCFFLLGPCFCWKVAVGSSTAWARLLFGAVFWEANHGVG